MNTTCVIFIGHHDYDDDDNDDNAMNESSNSSSSSRSNNKRSISEANEKNITDDDGSYVESYGQSLDVISSSYVDSEDKDKMKVKVMTKTLESR